MKPLARLLLALYAGLLLNSLLMFFWGDAGVRQMKTLQNHRDRLIENIEDLRKINDELALERDSLLYEEAAIELRARTFGYRRDGQIPVILPVHQEEASRTLGTLVRRITAADRNMAVLRALALCLSIALFAGSCIWRKYGHNNRGY
ncbi:MAG: septum formation initiator family protein [Spirochaetales bacterium]|nr:septum formation initiator family protein [Spirochaetales bacterium]